MRARGNEAQVHVRIAIATLEAARLTQKRNLRWWRGGKERKGTKDRRKMIEKGEDTSRPSEILRSIARREGNDTKEGYFSRNPSRFLEGKREREGEG